MPQALRNPMVWAAALLIAVAIGVVVIGSTDDQPELRDSATLSATISDLRDGVDGQVIDERTTTVGDVGDNPLVDLSGTPVFDERDRCAWLVGVPGTDSGIRYLVAWPTGTEIVWEPFRVLLPEPGPHDVLLPGDRINGTGEIYPDVAEVSDRDRARILGLDRCPHEAVLVFDDRPGNTTVATSGN